MSSTNTVLTSPPAPFLRGEGDSEGEVCRIHVHLAGLFGVSSLAWAGHLIHVALPESRGVHVGWKNFLSTPPHPAGLTPFWTGNWGVYAQNPDTPGHIFGTSQGAGDAILTFLGGFHPQTESLWLTDIAHHHLAIAVIFIIAGHQYRTNFGIGHSIKEMLNARNFFCFSVSASGRWGLKVLVSNQADMISGAS